MKSRTPHSLRPAPDHRRLPLDYLEQLRVIGLFGRAALLLILLLGGCAVPSPDRSATERPRQFPPGLSRETPQAPPEITARAVSEVRRQAQAIWVDAADPARARSLSVADGTEIAGPSPYGRGRGRPLGERLPPSRNNANREPVQTRALVSGFESTDFDDNAVNNSGFLFIPPDSHAAASTDHLINATNTTLRVHDKNGALLLDTSLQAFFSALSPVNALFDPKVIYDQYADRLVVLALELQDAGGGDPLNSSRILVAVSDDGNPLGTWYQVAINSALAIGVDDTWADFPGLGLDSSALYITTNQFAFSDQPNGFTLRGVRVWIVDKGAVGGFYGGAAASVAVFNQNSGLSPAFDITNQPAHVFGAAPSGVGTWLTSYSGLNDSVDQFVQVIRVDNPLSTPVFTRSFVNIGQIDSLISMPDAPQPTSSLGLDTGDRRTLNAVWNNNALWTVFHVTGISAPDSGQTTAAWLRLSASGSGPAFGDAGVIGGESLASSTHTYFPSIAADATGKAVIGFSASASTLFGGAYYTTRESADAAGTTRTPTLVRAGDDYYERAFGGARNRWGDYSATVLDTDTGCFWIYNQYAMTRGTPINGEDGRWATAFAEECPPEDTSDAPDSYGIARHVPDGGLRLGSIVDIEAPRVDSADALGDDNLGSDDEDGLNGFTSGSFSSGDSFEATLITVNTTGAAALVCGWIDFNDDGDFDNNDTGPELSNAERTCQTVANGQSSVTLSFTIPNDFVANGGADSSFFSRFRITSDWASSASADPVTIASDGEVEDHAIALSTLPVWLHSFTSTVSDQALTVRWTSVAETRNLAYRLLIDQGRGFETLTGPIEAQAGDPVLTRNYSQRIDIDGGAVQGLRLESIDLRGRTERFGPFQPGRLYGRTEAPNTELDWERIAGHLGDANPVGLNRDATSQAPRAIDLRVQVSGMQELTWQMLYDAGLDWTGVPIEHIAVTLKGQPVAREIVAAATPERTVTRNAAATGQWFGPGMAVRFWGHLPEFPDARYINHYIYRIAVDAVNARPVQERQSVAKTGSHWAMHRLENDTPAGYDFTNPLADPWYQARLRADTNPRHDVSFEIDSALLSDVAGHLLVSLGGITDFPADPDHAVELAVNGQVLRRAYFEGNSPHLLDVDIPAGVLGVGGNEVSVIAPGSSDAPFDVFVVDRVVLSYPRRLVAEHDRLLVKNPPLADGLTAAGFTTSEVIAYAEGPDGTLYRLPPEPFARGSVRMPQLHFAETDYWLSTRSALHRPLPVDTVGENRLLDEAGADLVVIAHPRFIPLPGEINHPLERWRMARTDEGWRVALFNIEEIQSQYGHGMPLPDALTDFLAALNQRSPFSHVLLVGGDSYDYRNDLGLGSISHLPTRYAPTRFITHTPSDALLGDLDGDGLADVSIGRWPVREFGDLVAIVDKTLAWPGLLAGARQAVWLSDSEDPRQPSFAEQAERLTNLLIEFGWLNEQIARIRLDDVQAPPGQSQAEAAREQLFGQIEAGAALSGFIGHGAPTMWTFQGLLTPDDLDELYNEGRPTLVSTMTCYTTYFVSPLADTVGHRWLNGYRTDGAGQRIPGIANGAIAVHGPATLSNYTENEAFVQAVLERMLIGSTLGQAIEFARGQAAELGYDDLVINWILLGDPTLRLE